MKIHDARALALDAIARGWLEPHQLWDVARRCTPDAPLADVFGETLTPARLEALSGERRSADTMVNVDAGPPSMGPASLPPFPGKLAGPRYTLREMLGSGGTGDVVAALDREVRRVVALKTLQRHIAGDRVISARFVEEARITAQLEHPNIVPVYDLGAAPDGQPYYTMRIVKKRSLRDVLGRPEVRAQWPTVRLVGAFLQVTRALEYAHSRGVLHRDVKPENILLGDFGEVYLADWGLAKLEATSAIIIHEVGSSPPPNVTNAGGTPGYISPEVLKGDWEHVDHRADLFALGVVLYEILVGRSPFDGNGIQETLFNTCEKAPQRPSTLVPDCPLLLEDLCLALLAKDPNARPQSAEKVAQQVEDFLEGAKERERRLEEARGLCNCAEEPVRRYHHLERERQRLSLKAREVLKAIKGWEPVQKKRAGWSLEDLADKADREAGLVLAEAIELYTKALGYDAACADAHLGLADLYWSRARAAEEHRRVATQVYYEALVGEHDQGHYAAILKSGARLSLRSNPPGAHVIAQRYFERERVLVAGDEEYLGCTPVREARLEPGSYVVTLKAEGFRDARYPLLLARGTHHEGVVNLRTEEELGKDFVYIPGGTAIIGGDSEAYESLPRQEIHVADFAIARFPVTLREYFAFIDHLDKDDATLALKRAPHDLRGSEGLLAVRDKDGWQPSPMLIEGDARALFPPEDGHLWKVPALLIDWFDATAFSRWRSARDGISVRLPTETEWEKAARGTDGRFYPWGDRFDPTFCLMRESRSFTNQPEPIGTFERDESPYGVRDMAGGMREWVGDVFGDRTAEELAADPEPADDVARGDSTMRWIRSGSWMTDHKWARAASRGPAMSLTRGTGLTFRLAKSLAPRE